VFSLRRPTGRLHPRDGPRERPHQALHGRPPAALYRPSPRAYPAVLPPIEYPGHFIVKRVTNAGTVRFKKRLVFIANALKQYPIGLEEVADGIWSIYFCRILLVTSYTRCKNEAA